MGEYTKNLQLYKVDTVEDANNTFNIETMLNDNWDKIDEKLEKLPVQNGGLYINSETTEEDKAEAQEALKEIGGFLPLDGSVPMSEQLRLKRANQNAKMYLNADNGYVWLIVDDGDFNNRRVVQLSSKSANASVSNMLRISDYVNGTNNSYAIFGEHNKPSGSYTGNGSATSREITIPALSTYDLITIQSSTGYIGLVGAWGAVFIDVTSSVAKGYSASVIKRTANGITIAGTENAFNKNGVTYYYGTI